MHVRFSRLLLSATLVVAVCERGWPDVPAPPVNQTLGMPDVMGDALTEAECRVCHSAAIPDRHHLLHGQAIPLGSQVPYPDGDGDGISDSIYGCLNCHDSTFAPVRDCTVCHTSQAHHKTPAAIAHDCVSCHGDLVDNPADGHYVPSYPMSDVTPDTSDGDGLPLNQRGNGAGACDYCHDDDGFAPATIRTNSDLHHATTYAMDGALDCLVCHEILDPLSIRTCEKCHGPDSLHNIQADSPNGDNLGIVVIGGEDAGYGHVGRDVGPGDSDCWGCHGFSISTTSGTGPTVPVVHSASISSMRTGTGASMKLAGASFVNMASGQLYESRIVLTSAEGLEQTVTPELILDEGTLVVTIPASIQPGNYRIRAIKGEFLSNPTSLTVLPKVTVTGVNVNGLVTIKGRGFGGYAIGSGTSVMGKVQNSRSGRWRTIEAAIVTWTDSEIVARFRETPQTLTIHSIFGEVSCRIGGR